MSSKEILAYNKLLSKDEKAICDLLEELITDGLPKAEGKVWHGHPVWFIGTNPVVGYTSQKKGIQLLFWSGQSFEEEKLVGIGKFKAAGVAFAELNEIKKSEIKRWLTKCKKIQWDYASLPKNKKLVKLTDF